MKFDRVKGGIFLNREIPNSFSISHLEKIFPIIKFERGASILPKDEKSSVRDKTQSDLSMECISTLATFASSIKPGISTWEGHSIAHILQLIHKSEISRISSELNNCCSLGEPKSIRARFALALGVACSFLITRLVGHILFALLWVLQSPHPLQCDDSINGEFSFHFSIGCRVITESMFDSDWFSRSPRLRKGQIGISEEVPTTFPGLNWLYGSNKSLIFRREGSTPAEIFVCQGKRDKPSAS